MSVTSTTRPSHRTTSRELDLEILSQYLRAQAAGRLKRGRGSNGQCRTRSIQAGSRYRGRVVPSQRGSSSSLVAASMRDIRANAAGSTKQGSRQTRSNGSIRASPAGVRTVAGGFLDWTAYPSNPWHLPPEHATGCFDENRQSNLSLCGRIRWPGADPTGSHESLLLADTVAKVFLRLQRATLIRRSIWRRNFDSLCARSRFHCCARHVLLRVLQQYRHEAGMMARLAGRLLSTQKSTCVPSYVPSYVSLLPPDPATANALRSANRPIVT